MKRIIRSIAGCAVCWAAVLAVCFGLLCAAAAVPVSAIRDHLLSSSDKLAVHAPHEKTINSLYSSTCDNYADAVLLGIAASMTPENPVRSALNTRYYDDDYGPAVGIRAILNGAEPNRDYTRYWHGSLVFVRPLLAVTDLTGIRIAGSVLLCLLLAADSGWLICRKHKAAAVFLFVSAALIHLPFVFTTVEYQSVFLIVLAVLPLYVRFAEEPRTLVILSAGVGTLTAFLDFLTAETLTLLVPLTMAFFIHAEKGVLPDEKKSLLQTIACGAAWAGGYLLTFAVKWAAASAVLGHSVTGTALQAAGERMTGSSEGISTPIGMIFFAWGANLSRLVPTAEQISIAGMLCWAGLFACVCILLYRSDTRTHNLPRAAMLLIAAIPFVRFAVLRNHSCLHDFFTYRALMSSIMALLGLMWYRVGTRVRRTKKA